MTIHKEEMSSMDLKHLIAKDLLSIQAVFLRPD